MVVIITTSPVSQTRLSFPSDENLKPVGREFRLIISFSSDFENTVIMDFVGVSVSERKFFFEEDFPSENSKLKICFSPITVYLNTT